jgi:uncharacterized OB-fold protein
MGTADGSGAGTVRRPWCWLHEALYGVGWVELMTNGERPLPDLSDPDTGAFWRAAQDHRLTYQVCAKCGRVVFYPRAHCPHCASQDLHGHDSEGRGTLYSYTVIRQTPHQAFQDDVPYIVALVDLDEGFRLLTHLQSDPELAEVGQRVSLEWISRGGIELPVFAPSEMSERGSSDRDRSVRSGYAGDELRASASRSPSIGNVPPTRWAPVNVKTTARTYGNALAVAGADEVMER